MRKIKEVLRQSCINVVKEGWVTPRRSAARVNAPLYVAKRKP